LKIEQFWPPLSNMVAETQDQRNWFIDSFISIYTGCYALRC